MSSTFWGKWVASVRIALSDTPIPAMDVKLGLLIARYLAGLIDSLSLGVVSAGSTGCPSLSNTPFLAIRNDMLTFFRHDGFLPSSPQI